MGNQIFRGAKSNHPLRYQELAEGTITPPRSTLLLSFPVEGWMDCPQQASEAPPYNPDSSDRMEPGISGFHFWKKNTLLVYRNSWRLTLRWGDFP